MISDRLLTIASLVDPDAIVADIGSDHALLPIYLVKEKIVTKAYAIDNKEGPLKAAIDNVKNYGLQDQVKTRLASGLNDLEADVDTAIIAGMGYKTISTIIKEDLQTAQKLQSLIIQCNNHIPELRMFLHQHRFEIIEEKFIVYNNREYLIFKVIYNEKLNEALNFYVSEKLINQNDSTYISYLKQRLEHLGTIKTYNKAIKEEYDEIHKILKK